MAGKRILLTLNDEIHKELKKKAENNMMTVQELITNILRKSVLLSRPRKKGAGRPQKIREPFLDYFSEMR